VRDPILLPTRDRDVQIARELHHRHLALAGVDVSEDQRVGALAPDRPGAQLELFLLAQPHARVGSDEQGVERRQLLAALVDFDVRVLDVALSLVVAERGVARGRGDQQEEAEERPLPPAPHVLAPPRSDAPEQTGVAVGGERIGFLSEQAHFLNDYRVSENDSRHDRPGTPGSVIGVASRTLSS